MNKVYTGGLGSYALSCTVIGYFNVGSNSPQAMYIVCPVLTQKRQVRKHTKPRKATREQYDKWLVNQDIYYLLVDYLTFWASQWKYAKHMLEPGEGIIYKKVSIYIHHNVRRARNPDHLTPLGLSRTLRWRTEQTLGHC